ncbi:hypothetical protein LNP04_19060 [Chryseobacterium sp. C-71]|uniref:hypothetical protein n=1 Tax=Chryseobacterium sp. C-71 TaxID=2893882 RepID=UPI001E6360D4|nr:hypothetical protein [Chryseobacterium sp. C-71]UFH32041.1 hypothetical protein LNP04_19060 [Chryseobacterium sp. C-71]
MKKHIYTITIFSLILLSCGEQSKQKKSKNTENIEIEQPKNEKLSNLELEASRLRAGGSIKNVELDSKFAKITYVKDYEEYKELNPQSGLSKTELNAYWESGDAIEKALVDGSVRIMKKLDYIDTVSILLPYKGTNYSILVNKKDLEKFIGSDFATIKNKWDETFSNPFVYDDKGRKSFFKKFGGKS